MGIKKGNTNIATIYKGTVELPDTFFRNAGMLKKLVRWLDWDGTVLKEEKVAKGATANPPYQPSRSGYRFSSWDVTYSDIQDVLDVTAQYTAIDESQGGGTTNETVTGSHTLTQLGGGPTTHNITELSGVSLSLVDQITITGVSFYWYLH